MWLCSSTVVSMTEWQKSVHNGVKLFFLYSFVSDFDIYIDIWGHFRAQQKAPDQLGRGHALFAFISVHEQ
jgi:hypothetical protein